MRLFELFNKTAKWRWNNNERLEIPGYSAQFTIGNKKYGVEFMGAPVEAYIDNYMWHGDGEEPQAFLDLQKTDPYAEIIEVSFFLKRGRHAQDIGITGTGNQFTVLSTVLAIIKAFLKNNPQTKYLLFSSKERSRTRLYKKIVDKLAPNHEEFEGAEGDETMFLVKVK